MSYRTRWIPVALSVAAAAPLSAQPAPADPAQPVRIALEAAPFPGEPFGPPEHITFLFADEGFDTKLVKGAPYQAEAVTEVVQALADGNRIVRKTAAAVYRDSEGRTRREHTVAAVGPLVPAEAPPRTVFISDPVAGTSYVLEVDSRIARKLPAPPEGFTREAGFAREAGKDSPTDRIFIRKVIRKPAGEHGPEDALEPRVRKLQKPKTESLGTQTIEGVEAEGTRSRVTIPAGEIGNERPIEVVTERWYSPQLQTVIMSRHSDPRLGDTTYRLTGVSRGEPDRTLFEVPSDYTVTDAPAGPTMKKFHKRVPPPNE